MIHTQPTRPSLVSASLAFLLGVTLGPSAALAADAEAEEHLIDGVAAYAQRDWDAALIALERAEREATSDPLRAQIARQFGLLYPEIDRPEDSLAAFRRALFLDPGLILDLSRVGPAVRTLFPCAQKLPSTHPPVTKLLSDGHGGWECPVSLEADVSPAPARRSIVVTDAGDRATTKSTTSTSVAAPAAPVPPVRENATLLQPAPPAVEPAGGLGLAGKLGVAILISGLAGGGGVFAWQTYQADSAADRADALARELSDPGFSGVVRTTLDELNANRTAYADHSYYANIGASVGGGVAGAGLLLIVGDLLWGSGVGDSEARVVGVVPGLASATVMVGF